MAYRSNTFEIEENSPLLLKLIIMNQDILLYTLPQWFVFSAVIASVYGWVEQKKTFRLMGPVIFFLLGLFALISLKSDLFASYEFLTPEEIVSDQMEDEINGDVPFQTMLFPAYLCFLITGLLAIPSFFLELKNRKGKNLLLIITALTGLMGFFIVVGALRSL
jgi:hypothetical protein